MKDYKMVSLRKLALQKVSSACNLSSDRRKEKGIAVVADFLIMGSSIASGCLTAIAKTL